MREFLNDALVWAAIEQYHRLWRLEVQGYSASGIHS